MVDRSKKQPPETLLTEEVTAPGGRAAMPLAGAAAVGYMGIQGGPVGILLGAAVGAVAGAAVGAVLHVTGVDWNAAPGQKRRGYGKLARRASRLVRKHEESQPIRSVEAGICRIRGTVQVLSPVELPDGGSVAAFSHHQREQRTTTSLNGRHKTTRTLRRHTAAFGRFAIVDKTGTAVVDDDHVVLWAGKGAHLIDEPTGEPTRERRWTVKSGDTVEVVGKAKWTEAVEAATMRSGYRERGEVLSFEGSSKAPIVVVVGDDGPEDEQD